MLRYVLFIDKNRKLLLFILLIVLLLAIIGARQIQIDPDFNIFQLSSSEAANDLTQMTEMYGDGDQTILMYEVDTDWFDTVERVSRTLTELSIAHISPTRMKTLSEEFLAPELSPIVTQDDKTYVIFTITLDAGFDMNQLYDHLDGTYYLAGNTYMQNEMLTLIGSILMHIPPLALLLVLFTFRSQLHSFKAAVLSIVPAGLASLFTLGIAGWSGDKLSIITVLAPIFTIVIGSADGLHFISHMEDEYDDPIEGLAHTLKLIGVPMIITSATSIAGFMSLLLIKTDAIRSLAFYASIGILLAGLTTWYVLPLILTGKVALPHGKQRIRSTFSSRFWGLPSLVLTVLLLLVSLFAHQINREFNQLMFFEDNTAVQQNFIKISEINDGAVPVYFFGTYKDNEISEIRSTFQKLKENASVNRIIQPFDYPEALKTPLALQFLRTENNLNYYRAIIYPSDTTHETLNSIINAFEQTQLNGRITGIQVLMKELNDTVVRGQLISIASTIVLIILMLKYTLKTWRLTLVSALPVLISSICMYGFLGITGISLNLMTATIFSISLGIGIDYAIHYVSVYKYYLDEQVMNPREVALKYTERPILANAFGLAIGMTALRLSPLTIHNDVSSMMWFAMMTSVILTLTLVPTLLKCSNKK